MPKKFFRRITPSPETFKSNKHLQFLGDTLNLTCLWHLNRRTLSRALAIGLFVMWLPLPFHVLMVATAVVFWRANLPIAILTAFINNPFTMGPMYYFDYWLGKELLGGHFHAFKFEASLHWITHGLPHIWQPLALGTLVLASLSALLGYYGLLLLWRWHVIRQWRRRKCKGKAAKASPPTNDV
jgi:uncharacterized protein (DUF2062 family)